MSQAEQDIINQMYIALNECLTADGCVLGCPRKKSSDNAHNMRCVMVRAAIESAKKIMR